MDAAAWAHANGVGATATVARLDAPIQAVSKRLKDAGVHVPRPVASTAKSQRMLAELRDLGPGDSWYGWIRGAQSVARPGTRCGYAVRGDVVWPKTRRVADEIAMVVSSAGNPLTVHEVRDRLITRPSLVTVRNRLSDDRRFHPVQRGIWTLAVNHSERQI